MAIIVNRQWQKQYFSAVSCPEDLIIPTDDVTAYPLFPEHNWVYNKLWICKTQGVVHAPHGIQPTQFPVFSKPIYNLLGMGAGSRLLKNIDEYRASYTPGHLWMENFTGAHVSTDAAVVDGSVVWWKHTTGIPGVAGTFRYWKVHKGEMPDIELYCRAWCEKNLKAYSGMINIETIGGRIIEVQLRFAPQWPDLYGTRWIDAVVELYRSGVWKYTDTTISDGYSVVLFGPHRSESYLYPPHEFLTEIQRRPSISSIQITFHDGVLTAHHAMPPGGFRLAVVNCWDLAEGEKAKQELATWFGITPVE